MSRPGWQAHDEYTRRTVLAWIAGAGACLVAPVLDAAPGRGRGRVHTGLTGAERDAARTHLADSRDALVSVTAGFTEAQWHYRPDPGTWSAADNLEHVTVVEEQVYGQVTTAVGRLSARAADDRPRVKDHVILLVATNRERRRLQAPEAFRPTGRWGSPEGKLAAFQVARARTLAYVEATSDDLRSRAWDNPVVGLVDGYQWLLFMSGHALRHARQVRDLTRLPAFPERRP